MRRNSHGREETGGQPSPSHPIEPAQPGDSDRPPIPASIPRILTHAIHPPEDECATDGQPPTALKQISEMRRLSPTLSSGSAHGRTTHVSPDQLRSCRHQIQPKGPRPLTDDTDISALGQRRR
ncbi:hypothetical protein D779_0382 [Imhoffiella purpurea]|uniref:Uncharacterized protein n=1 Tax=Imhoffiella purpurea TaxID=1249627 RepID=W9W0V8_9GAMM|nr:hypothetical protein D779_0382 [Imhoffiella purpurea]